MGTVPSIGSYRDLVAIGRGGFGTVYRATEDRFGRKVAIKVIRDAGVGRDVVARFERECLALGSLSGHPNIVAVHDQGATEDGDLYLVMELLSGGSFAQRLATRGRVQPADAVVWGGALAGALETAHRSGIVHRDVKPENILFSEYGEPKLVDFGIARMRSAYETRTGFVSATLNHAAPEIVAGAAVSPSADVYSLASVLYTMLSGEAPFDRPGDESLAPLIARIATAPPPDLRRLGVPPELSEVLEKALRKQPEERYESAAAFGLALGECARSIGVGNVEVPLGQADEVAEAAATMAEGPPTPVPTPMPMPHKVDLTVDVPRERLVVPTNETPSGPPARARRWPLAVAAVVVLALVGGGAAALATRGGDDAAAGDGTGDPDVVAAALPDAAIGASECTGFDCTFTVTSPTPLPEGATWVWTIEGAGPSVSGSTVQHTFKMKGKRTISVASSLDGATGTPASAVVELDAWRPKVAVTPAVTTTALGRIAITVTSPEKPACRVRSVRLQVKSGSGFVDQGGRRGLAANGTATVEVARDETYRIAVAGRDVADGICAAATSRAVYVPDLPVVVAPPDPATTTPSTPSPSPSGSGGGNGGGSSTLPPVPTPGR